MQDATSHVSNEKDAGKSGIRDAILAELVSKRNEAVKALDSLRRKLIGHSHVVLNSYGVALKYEINGGGELTGVSVAGSAINATRFDKFDADKVAATTVDGRGNPGRAVHVTDALREEIDRIETVFAYVKSE